MDGHRGSARAVAQRRRLVAVAVLGAAVALGAVLVSRSPVSAPIVVPDESASGEAVPEVGAPEISPPDPVPWDAVAWTHLQGAFAPGDPTPIRMDGLLNADTLLIGWGRALTEGRNQFNDMGAVFISPDGRSWRTILIDHGVGAPDTSELWGVAAGPLGLLAFGGVCCAMEVRAVWHSPDGVAWQRLALGGDLEPRASRFAAVVGLADGWVAVGSEGAEHTEGRIWTSPDGATWTAVDPEEAGLGAGTVSDIAAGPEGLVAVGTIDGPDGTHDGGIWLSADGSSWERVGADDPQLTGR